MSCTIRNHPGTQAPRGYCAREERFACRPQRAGLWTNPEARASHWQDVRTSQTVEKALHLRPPGMKGRFFFLMDLEKYGQCLHLMFSSWLFSYNFGFWGQEGHSKAYLCLKRENAPQEEWHEPDHSGVLQKRVPIRCHKPNREVSYIWAVQAAQLTLSFLPLSSFSSFLPPSLHSLQRMCYHSNIFHSG